MLHKLLHAIAPVCIVLCTVLASGPVLADSPLTASEALERLQAGNLRLLAGETEHPDFSLERITDTGLHGQFPFATILGCSDSRVPVELIFDQGIGDLFVIRDAGNICSINELASAEFGVAHLGTPLLVVLGHSHCGAVSAAVKGAHTEGSIDRLLEHIAPAVERSRAVNPAAGEEELIAIAVKENVWLAIEQLLAGSTVLSQRAAAGSLMLVGAVYDIESGRVDWLGEHPQLTELLTEPAQLPAASAAAAPAL